MKYKVENNKDGQRMDDELASFIYVPKNGYHQSRKGGKLCLFLVSHFSCFSGSLLPVRVVSRPCGCTGMPTDQSGAQNMEFTVGCLAKRQNNATHTPNKRITSSGAYVYMLNERK